MDEMNFSVFPSENLVDLELYQFGREQCAPAHSFGPAARNHFLFHYVLSGAGTLIADDGSADEKTYRISGGQGFMIFPNRITTYIADRNEPWEYVWIEFDGLRVRTVLETSGLSREKPVYRAKFDDLREKMAEEMLYINANRNEPPLHLIGHLYMFIDYLSRSSAAAQPKQCSPLREFYVHEAMVFIESRYHDDITVEDIAAACGLNRSYFGKIFKQSVGRSPQEFLLSYRMAKAAELLETTRLPVGEVGGMVGYANPLHFSRAFKNENGVSPKDWRNARRQSISDSGQHKQTAVKY